MHWIWITISIKCFIKKIDYKEGTYIFYIISPQSRPNFYFPPQSLNLINIEIGSIKEKKYPIRTITNYYLCHLDTLFSIPISKIFQKTEKTKIENFSNCFLFFTPLSQKQLSFSLLILIPNLSHPNHQNPTKKKKGKKKNKWKLYHL